MKVRPHALREHVPLLQGPLPTASSDAEHLGLMGLSDRGDAAMSLALLRPAIPSPSLARPVKADLESSVIAHVMPSFDMRFEV